MQTWHMHKITQNSPEDEIANVNFYDIVHVIQNTKNAL